YLLSLNLTFCLCSGVICQHVTPVKDEKSGSADSPVSLSCNYSKGAADYFFWYRQHPGKPPEFLTFNTEVEETQKESQSRLSGRRKFWKCQYGWLSQTIYQLLKNLLVTVCPLNWSVGWHYFCIPAVL
uniref:Immunoglobulin V-set domain-containing protein n=1 Tax=Xiphophorus couchianus TaxID=32473 RepID=A0A3B5LLL1_9TELE